MSDRSPKPWRNWYHCMGNTFGTWLPGDPRGFRTFHHAQHVEGDYRFPPPPGEFDRLWQHNRQHLARRPVFIAQNLRPMVCRLLAEALIHHQVQIVELSISGCHFHLLARFVPVGVDPCDHLQSLNIKLTHSPRTLLIETPKSAAFPGGRPSRSLRAYDHDPAPRRLLGLARTCVAHRLKQMAPSVVSPGGLWTRKFKVEPIRSREHQLAAARYIHRHREQGAAIYSATRS